MDRKYIMALDQGTTSSRAILFDKEGNIVATSQKEFTQFYPKVGWVEHNPMEIWGSQSGVMREVLETNSIRPEEVCAIGITNQRETTIVWEKSTGKPVYNAIVWQCRRTSEICDELKEKGYEKLIKDISFNDVQEYSDNILKNSDIHVALSANREFYNKHEEEIQTLLINIFNATKNNE